MPSGGKDVESSLRPLQQRHGIDDCGRTSGRYVARTHRVQQSESAYCGNRRADRRQPRRHCLTLPANMSLRATVLGPVTGFFPIGWIVLNVIFLYRLTVEKGVFETLQNTIGGVTNDRRLQLLLIAFSFGAFFEGASGFGTPVAVTGAILIGLGFSPLAASGLSLIANTAPVAYGALGTPIAGLASVTGIDPFPLGAMVGRQLPFFSLIVPFWLIWAFAGFRGMLAVWPA